MRLLRYTEFFLTFLSYLSRNRYALGANNHFSPNHVRQIWEVVVSKFFDQNLLLSRVTQAATILAHYSLITMSCN